MLKKEGRQNLPQTLTELKSYERNPRAISEKALTGLRYSIEMFGDLSGIVFNRQLGCLVAGHQRVRALREQYGELTVSEDGAIQLPTGESFQVRIVEWDEEKHKAALVAANNEFISGRFTDEAKQLLTEISAQADLFLGLNLDPLQTSFDFMGTVAPLEQKSAETPEEKREAYAKSTFRQIVLIYNLDNYKEIVEKLNVIKEAQGFQDNTQAVTWLVREWKNGTS